MKIVIDTNVLVSAVLKDRDPEKVIVDVMLNPERFAWMVSTEILAEYFEVLSRPKFGLPAAIVNEWTNRITRATTLAYPTVSIEFARDRKDAKFVACALATDARFLITGDKDFASAERIMSTTVVSVSMFRRLLSL